MIYDRGNNIPRDENRLQHGDSRSQLTSKFLNLPLRESLLCSRYWSARWAATSWIMASYPSMCTTSSFINIRNLERTWEEKNLLDPEFLLTGMTIDECFKKVVVIQFRALRRSFRHLYWHPSVRAEWALKTARAYYFWTTRPRPNVHTSPSRLEHAWINAKAPCLHISTLQV